jgi:putative transposase
MRKSRFTEEQIIKVLKEHAAGLSAGELCRKYGVSDATFYIYGLLPRGKKAQNLVDVVDCKHLSGVTGRWCAQMGNPLTPTSTSGRPRRPL